MSGLSFLVKIQDLIGTLNFKNIETRNFALKFYVASTMTGLYCIDKRSNIVIRLNIKALGLILAHLVNDSHLAPDFRV